MECTTSSQFNQWRQFFEEELTGFNRETHLAAILAYEIYQLKCVVVLGLTGGKMNLPQRKVDDFLCRFGYGEVKTEEDLKDEEEEQQIRAAIAAKASVMAMFGLSADGTPTRALANANALPQKPQPATPQPPKPRVAQPGPPVRKVRGTRR